MSIACPLVLSLGHNNFGHKSLTLCRRTFCNCEPILIIYHVYLFVLLAQSSQAFC